MFLHNTGDSGGYGGGNQSSGGGMGGGKLNLTSSICLSSSASDFRTGDSGGQQSGGYGGDSGSGGMGGGSGGKADFHHDFIQHLLTQFR